MITNPIIPVWIMAIFCIVMLLLKRKGAKNFIRQILVVILLFVINLRPMIPGDGIKQVETKNIDILFVVDNTLSMLARDYRNEEGMVITRHEAIANDIDKVMRSFSGASFALITFDNDSQVAVPYTNDMNTISNYLLSLTPPASTYADGTSMNNALRTMDTYLDNERETIKIVFYITDGELTGNSSRNIRVNSSLVENIDLGVVLGYGTEEGGTMVYENWFGGSDTIMYYDENGNYGEALSKIDEDTLEEVAEELGISYVYADPDSDSYIEGIVNEFDDAIDEGMNIETTITEKTGYIYEDIYYIFCIPLLVILVVDFIAYNRKLKLEV